MRKKQSFITEGQSLQFNVKTDNIFLNTTELSFIHLIWKVAVVYIQV